MTNKPKSKPKPRPSAFVLAAYKEGRPPCPKAARSAAIRAGGNRADLVLRKFD